MPRVVNKRRKTNLSEADDKLDTEILHSVREKISKKSTLSAQAKSVPSKGRRAPPLADKQAAEVEKGVQPKTIVSKAAQMSKTNRISIEPVITDTVEEQQEEQHPINYMQRANPPGKKRDVGGQKRNRKEQMSISDQIQTSLDVAASLEARVAADSDQSASSLLLAAFGEAEKSDTTRFLLPRRTDAVQQKVGGVIDMTSASVETSLAIGRRTLPNQCGAIDASHPLCERLLAEKWKSVANEQTGGGNSSNANSARGEAITKTTRSADLLERDYSVFERRKYTDNTYKQQVLQAQQDEFLSACNHIATSVIVASSGGGNDSVAGEKKTLEQLRADAEEIYRRSGYGESIITMEDFDVLGVSHEGKKCAYPMRSRLRCRYDHHQFDSVPVLLPLRWYPAKNLLSVNSRMVFCSFSCALAFIEREMSHDIARAERRSLLEHVARTFFAVSEPLRPAPFLEQHEDYGGMLSTAQFRALGNTHYSFIEQPIVCAAVPCKIVTQIVMHQRVDRAKRQALNLRTREEHMSAVPDEPIDPLARVDQAARGGGSGGVADEAGGGKKRKERVASDAQGKRVVINSEHINARIAAVAQRKSTQQPAVKHALGKMIVERTLEKAVDDATTAPSSTSNVAASGETLLPPPPKAKRAKKADATETADCLAATKAAVALQGGKKKTTTNSGGGSIAAFFKQD